MEKKLENILNNDSCRNISVLEFFSQAAVIKVYREGNSFIILGESDHIWAYISSNNRQEFIKLIHKYNCETKYFASVEKWMLPILLKQHELDWELATDRYILPEDVVVSSPRRKVSGLQKSDADYIYNYSDYKKFTSIEYIQERIDNGISAGIFEDGKLVAWGLSHDDNALGFLYVLPEYRKKGYAQDITSYLIKLKRKMDKDIFLNVEKGNRKSESLVRKMGFMYDREISWIKWR